MSTPSATAGPPGPFSFLRLPRQSRISEAELARNNVHLMQALEEEKHVGHRIAVIARTVALAIIAVLLPFLNLDWSVLYYEALLLAFVVIGLAQYRVGRVGASRLELSLLFIDLALLTYTIVVPNPWFPEDIPTAFQYRFDNFIYFFVLLAGGTLAYSWRTISAIGTWTAGLWLAALAIVYWFGHRIPGLSEAIAAALPGSPTVAALLDPNDPRISLRVQEVVVFLIVASILALRGYRTNELLVRQAGIAAERANLSRYFPPSIVDDLAQRANPLGEVRSQEVAVLFADIVGFTRIAETLPPQRTVTLLRDYHALLAKIVFDHGGTLDKFLGDGIMATFGTPKTAPDDAARALAAARDIIGAAGDWNAAAAQAGNPVFPISVGVHYGPVVLGDIGTANRLEFATLGDTVNVASRLESMTRELHCRLAISDDLLRHADSPGAGPPDPRSGLTSHPRTLLRGRHTPIDIWTA